MDPQHKQLLKSIFDERIKTLNALLDEYMGSRWQASSEEGDDNKLYVKFSATTPDGVVHMCCGPFTSIGGIRGFEREMLLTILHKDIGFRIKYLRSIIATPPIVLPLLA